MIKNGHNKTIYFFLAPALILAGLFIYWPLVELFIISMQKTNFITTKFVWFQNYVDLFKSVKFVSSLKNTGFYIILMVIGQIGMATFLSLVVCNLSKKWQDFTRFAFYIPILSAGVFIASFWKWIFHFNGPLNYFLGLIGIAPIIWLAHSVTAIPAIVCVVILSSLGGNMIMILAAILSIDKSMIDQAQIDGASWRQIKTKIILPQIMPIIILLSFVSVINATQVVETVMFLAPYDFSATITYAIYDMAFTLSQHGLASAGAVVLMIFVIGLNFIKNRIEKRNNEIH